MNVRAKMLAVAVAAAVAVGVITTATASAHKPGAWLAAGHHRGSITGYPTQINTVDLTGYTIVTSYTLGNNTGSTFQQDYSSTSVDAFAIGGPFVGGGHFDSDYTALPVGHHKLMIASGSTRPAKRWSTDIFVMNFKTGIVSDIAPPNAQPVSLGTVKIVTYGPTRSRRRAESISPLVGRGRRAGTLSSALAQQEVERRAVERLGILVQPGVRQVLEDHQLAPGDPALERLGEARGADEVARSEGDQGRSADLAQHRARVVGDGCLGLGQERVQWLGGAATHEVRQRVHELRPLDVHLGREAPAGRCAWITTSATVGSVDATVRHSSTTVFR